MDDFSIGGEELREALRHLRTLNRIFGASGPVLSGVRNLWTTAGRPSCLTVLDVGAGSGDTNQQLLRWARRERIRLRLVLMDKTEEALKEARALYADDPSVEITQGDLFLLPEKAADIVTASQLLHHFGTDELTHAVQRMSAASRIGIVISDIHRHPVAWATVWLMTRLLTRNRYIRHDGPLSVAKGFQAGDWARLQEETGIPLDVRWKAMFRYVVTAQSNDGERDGRAQRF
ncbi:methyltransferase domain-containing protein [Cohnella pontilimi]|nr:methyltransferase domain-containing protein [Cohnella pontilimi]